MSIKKRCILQTCFFDILRRVYYTSPLPFFQPHYSIIFALSGAKHPRSAKQRKIIPYGLEHEGLHKNQSHHTTVVLLIQKEPPAEISAGGLLMYGVDYTTPCAIMASTTFWKPAMFAPATRSPSMPYSLAALKEFQ